MDTRSSRIGSVSSVFGIACKAAKAISDGTKGSKSFTAWPTPPADGRSRTSVTIVQPRAMTSPASASIKLRASKAVILVKQSAPHDANSALSRHSYCAPVGCVPWIRYCWPAPRISTACAKPSVSLNTRRILRIGSSPILRNTSKARGAPARTRTGAWPK